MRKHSFFQLLYLVTENLAFPALVAGYFWWRESYLWANIVFYGGVVAFSWLMLRRYGSLRAFLVNRIVFSPLVIGRSSRKIMMLVLSALALYLLHGNPYWTAMAIAYGTKVVYALWIETEFRGTIKTAYDGKRFAQLIVMVAHLKTVENDCRELLIIDSDDREPLDAVLAVTDAAGRDLLAGSGLTNLRNAANTLKETATHGIAVHLANAVPVWIAEIEESVPTE